MKATDSGLQRVFLKPGELHVAERPTLVTTLLGSCISVTMFSAGHRIGAISHALLPGDGRCGGDLRYVDRSILAMLERLARLSVNRSELEVKLFGGADCISRGNGGDGIMVGVRNIEAALRTLREQGLKLAASDLGGIDGRKIVFHSHTGEVFLKRLPRSGGGR